MSPVPEIASPINVTRPRFFFYKITHIFQTQVNKLTCVCSEVWQHRTSFYHLVINQFMILFIVLGLLSDMTDWDINRNMTLPVLYDKYLFMTLWHIAC